MGICTGTNLLQELQEVFSNVKLDPQTTLSYHFASDSRSNLMRLCLPTHLLDKWSCGRVASARDILFGMDVAIYHTPRRFNIADVLCKGNQTPLCYNEFHSKMTLVLNEFKAANGAPPEWIILAEIPHIREAPKELREALLPRKTWGILSACDPTQPKDASTEVARLVTALDTVHQSAGSP